MSEDETTFLCGYKKLPRYGTTSSAGSKQHYSSIVKHHVLPSDTLQGIALKYETSITEIKRVNKLWSNDSIHLREVLHIPILSSSVAPAGAVPAAASAGRSAVAPNGLDSCYDSMSENEDANLSRVSERQTEPIDTATPDKIHLTWKPSNGETADSSAAARRPSSVYDKSECSISDLLSRIDSTIKSTAKNVKKLEKHSTIDRFLYDDDSTGVSASASRQSFQEVPLTRTPSPIEVRMHGRRSLSKLSLQKLQEAHDQLYQL